MEAKVPIASAEVKRLRYWAAGLSVGAGLVHGWVTPGHLSEWWGYGLFFLFAGLIQGGYGLLLLMRPWQYDETGGFRSSGDRLVRQYDRLAYQLGILGNAAVVALYVVTRTIGIPPLGPEAGEVEPVTLIDVVSKSLELALIACLILLVRHTPSDERAIEGR